MKTKALIFLILSVLLLLTACKQSGEKNKITVFADGKTGYSVIMANGASEDEERLVNRLAELSDTDLPILTDDSSEESLEIIIGKTGRQLSEKYYNKLLEYASVTYFHYLIAEEGGKVIILADDGVGYLYAIEYIENTFIDDGVFRIPGGICEVREVLWDVYYSSDIYYERLVAEADKNRFEYDKDQLENEMNKYEDNKNSVMTLDQAIEQYKAKLSSFNTADFGEYSSSTFESAAKYGDPGVRPESGAHPRILFTENTIDDVRDNLEAEESSAAYKKMIALSDAACDGIFPTLSDNETDNYSSTVSAKIEAKAFRYAMTGEKIYGYEALYALKNALLTIDVKHTVADWCRSYGHLMYVLGCVYDWCYDLMTEEDKAQLIAGGVNLLGMHLEIVCYVSSTNKVPTAQGGAYGHGAEDQILVDYLAFAIACYDEAPEIYELVGGRIINEHVEMQNFLFQSGTTWEGSMYGMVRMVSTMVSNILFNRMTNGAFTPFEGLEDAVVSATYWIRPDGHVYRIGDINENNTAYQFYWFKNNCFYAGNFYGNTYLKSVGYEYLNGFTSFGNGVAGLSAVQFLAVNDPEVAHTHEEGSPLVYTATYPSTSLFAKSSNTKNAFGLYMSMPECYAASHAHMECGSFQIYYKGALATDSGAYDSWGGTHHMGYNMQTISSNSLLIYNPNLKDYKSAERPNMVYSGGQSIDNGDVLPNTYEELMAHAGLGQCTSLGVANVESDGKYVYSYMAGDMTKAYDTVTVDEVCRYMFAVATGNSKCPYAVLTFDRITSDDPSYRKSALIHVQNAPTVTDDGFVIITNGGGRLVVQTVGEATEYTVIGGEGKEFWIPGVDENGNYSLEAGRNIPTSIKLVSGSLAEYGWGRVEISPEVADDTNYMLTVMYVTDSTNNSTPTTATDISSDNLAGAMIFGKAILFPKNEKLLTEEADFSLGGSAECFVTGVSAGRWTVMCGSDVVAEIDVADGTNMLTFNADAAGNYTLTPTN